MNSFRITTIFVCIIAVVAVLNLSAQSARNTAQQAAQQSQTPQIEYEYGTLTTQAINENDRMTYTITWNAGIQDIIGRSTNSLNDAMRQLSSRLGGSNSARTNLSVLFNAVGQDGWRLVESTSSEFGMVRTFIRVRR